MIVSILTKFDLKSEIYNMQVINIAKFSSDLYFIRTDLSNNLLNRFLYNYIGLYDLDSDN